MKYIKLIKRIYIYIDIYQFEHFGFRTVCNETVAFSVVTPCSLVTCLRSVTIFSH
jgi:hypothetical protein